MTWVQVWSCLLVVCVLVASAVSSICPESCECSTHDGLHRATCSSLADLYKFTLRQRHHNINILDLSHNNITKLSYELDRLTEVVTLDLSTNGITEVNKFLHNAKKLVHLNLANNRIKRLSLLHLPASVSSLDLTNNLLQDVPWDYDHLVNLEHLELDGNPLDCSCENLKARDRLLASNVFIDKAKCFTPDKFKGKSWLEIKVKNICKVTHMDIMMGDQGIDALKVGEDTSALKSESSVSSKVIKGLDASTNDENEYIPVKREIPHEPTSAIEDGSGDGDSTTISPDIEPRQATILTEKILENEEFLNTNEKDKVEQTFLEGSGDEGSGDSTSGYIDTFESTTPYVREFVPVPVQKLNNFHEDEALPTPSKPPPIFQGNSEWPVHTDPSVVTKDTTVSEKVTKELASKPEEGKTHKTGTYICIAIIVVLLVGLIVFAIMKGQIRKRRDRRLLRQQKRDVEASKEMVDMNKSLLGKPAVAETPVEKKINGKYELVPTHEAYQKKNENGDVANGHKNYNDSNGANGVRTDSPRDTNQNKSSSKDNNLLEDKPVAQDTSFDSVPDSPDSRKDSNSLASEEIFVPSHDDDLPKLNGNRDSDASHPLINGDQNTDSDFLSPSREYVPVYSPDMGRVRIKMTETPKPKTPILVTRSRSNAGDIIITPALDANLRKSTT